MRLFFLFLIMMISFSAQAKAPKINVLIGKKKKQVAIKGRDLVRKMIAANKSRKYSGSQTIKFNCHPNDNQKLTDKKKPIYVAKVNSLTGLINWNQNKYRGEILLLTDKKQRSCNVVNRLPLEFYISSLLSKEMSSDWPIEALKAQAVAARSYAYHKIKTKQVSKLSGYETFYHVENSEKHQVTGTFFDETKRTSLATKLTKGEILTNKKGDILPIFFHSKCGGKTLRPHQVWGGYMDEYSSVKCPFCHQHGMKSWKREIKKNNFHKTLNTALNRYYGKPVIDKSNLALAPDTKRRSDLLFYSKAELKGVRKASIRKILGTRKLPSNNYRVIDEGEKVVIKGEGYGHGVGMCQYGAFELARKGYTYKQILSYYFPKLKLKKMY
jgi:stage II sporulation protein D